MDFLLTWSNTNLPLLDLPLFPFDLSSSPFFLALRHEDRQAGRRKGIQSMEFTSHFLLLHRVGLPPKIHMRAEHDWERLSSREGE
jgi:hypothetical protein